MTRPGNHQKPNHCSGGLRMSVAFSILAIEPRTATRLLHSNKISARTFTFNRGSRTANSWAPGAALA